MDNILEVSQIFNTYIVFEYDEELWFIDQHAAAEKILFEKLIKQSLEIKARPLLIPEIVTLKSEEEKDMLIDNKGEFEKLGFKFDDFGDNTIQILEIPDLSTINNFYEIINDFFKDEKELGVILSNEIMSEYNLTKVQYLRLATIACHGSIRAGATLNRLEMKQIIKDVLSLETSAKCPHGRPILWRLTKTNLERHFNRDI